MWHYICTQTHASWDLTMRKYNIFRMQKHTQNYNHYHHDRFFFVSSHIFLSSVLRVRTCMRMAFNASCLYSYWTFPSIFFFLSLSVQTRLLSNINGEFTHSRWKIGKVYGWTGKCGAFYGGPIWFFLMAFEFQFSFNLSSYEFCYFPLVNFVII